MRVMVCGDRFANGSDYPAVTRVLNEVHSGQPVKELIHGACRGIDDLAGRWARENNVQVAAYPADWTAHERAAGPIRNGQMIATKPDIVLAFYGGKGTADAVRQARAAGIAVREFRRGWLEVAA